MAAMAAVVCFLLGAATALAGKLTFDMSWVRGQEPAAAAAALLQEAEAQAGGGTWERIAVGAVYYRSGDRARGQKLFDAVLGADPEASDYFRIGRVYALAGEWDKAKPMFEKALALKPKDDSGASEAACWGILFKDREWAEAQFERAITDSPGRPYHYSDMAGAYLGLQPGK
jgi:tetratricopeptide (TPR) repeat protein